MARSPEVTTIASLRALLEASKKELLQAEEASKVAKSVEKIPDAFKILNASAQGHVEEAFKLQRKVVSKIAAAIAESGATSATVEALIQVADSLKLFKAK